MCGRIALNTPADILAEIFGLSIPSDYHPRYNIAPTQDTLVICASDTGHESLMARWGFIPSWRKADQKGPEPINARSETAATSLLFGSALKSQRCIVPASGFYEWQAVQGQKRKRPHVIKPVKTPVLALAGLWSRWQLQENESIDTFTILTCAPNETMKQIHHRMPVILPPSAINPWLDPALDDVQTITKMLQPAPAASITTHEVSTWINSTAHDDPRCIEPVSKTDTLF